MLPGHPEHHASPVSFPGLCGLRALTLHLAVQGGAGSCLQLCRCRGQAWDPCPCHVPGAWHPPPAFQGVLESFLGTAFAGSIFCLFSGQPLTILSSTGPVLVFERLLFSFSQ